MAWQFLGPQPIADEVYSGVGTTGGNASGRVCALALDPGDPLTAYAAAAQGGVWKTTDGGAHWTPLTDGLSSLASGALALDPQDATIVWYGTGEQNFSIDSFPGDGLFRSTTAGASWSKIAAKTTVGSYIARVALPPTSSSVILVASDRGIVRSASGGSSWAVTLSGSYATDVGFDNAVSPTAYAALYGVGIFKSTDLGASWTQVYAPGLNTVGRINLGVSASSPGTLYASVVHPTTYGLLALLKSTDYGATWTTLSAPDYLTGKANNGQGFYDNCIVVDPTTANTVYVGGSDPVSSANALLASTNGGSTWIGRAIGVDNGRLHPDHHALAIGSTGVLWDANDGGIWTSTDGGLHWTNRNATLALTQFYSVALDPSDATTVIGGTQDNGTIGTSAGSTAWTQIVNGDGGPCFLDPASPSTLYTSYVFLRPVLKWVPNVSPVDITGGAAHDWNGDAADWANGVLQPDPNATATFWAGTTRLWRSTNAGASWSAYSSTLTRTPSGVLRSLGLGTGAPHAVYAGSSDGAFFATTDTSAGFWDRSSGLPTRPIPDIAVSPTAWQTLYVCSDTTAGSRVFNSSTDGRAWISATGDLPSGLRPLSLAADFRAAPPSLFVGTDRGVYMSVNGGAHWTLTGLPAVAVYDLAINTLDNTLVAATHGRGMWALPLAVTRAPSPEEAPDRTPSAVSVRGVGHAGEIRFTLATGGAVLGDVFTLDGRRVAHERWDALSAGSHTWRWVERTAATLASGLYRVRLTRGTLHREAWSLVIR